MKINFAHRVGRLAALIFLLAGPLLGWAAYRITSHFEHERARLAFEVHLSERAALLQKEVYDIAEELNHIRAYFSAHNGLTRTEFRTLTQEILDSHPAIHALEWVPRITANQRNAHERAARAEGLQGYEIRKLLRQGEMVPAPQQEEYYPVYYAEPLERNERAIGIDISSLVDRRAALALAMRLQKVTLTDPVDLTQEKKVAKGFLALMPIFQELATKPAGKTVEIEGFLIFELGVHEIVAESLLLGGGPPGIRFQLLDDDVGGKSEVFDSSPDWDSGREQGDEVYVRSIALVTQNWRLQGQPTAEFLDDYLTKVPVTLGIGVFLLWEALMGLWLSLSKWFQNLALRKQDHLYKSVWHSLTEGVIVAGADGKFLLFNETAQRILGIGPKEVSPSEWSSTYGCYYPDMRTPYPPEQLPLSRALRGLEVRESEVFIRNVNVPGGLWISVNGAPLVEEDGAPAGGVVVFRDITEPRKQREALERLSNAVEKTADTVFITNRDGVIEYVNPAFEATTGYSSAEALGNNPRILKSGKVEAEKYRDLWKNILNGEVYRTTTINRKKSGELYHAEQTITPMKNSEGQVTHFVSVLKDVTENLERQKREIEMHYASMVQKKLYPVESPKLAGFDIEGAVFPAEATCGDYFDYLSMPNRALGIAIGDVCGHGLGPAFIMAETRAYVRSLAKGCSEPNEILDPINEWLHSDLEEASYVTLLLARIDVSARSLVYANAGHTPGYILDRAGRLKAVLDSTGLPLGMFPHSKCAASERLDFVPGDLLVLLTDGITESEGPDGSMFEGDRVLEVIRAHQEEPAEQIVLHVRRAIWDFTQSVKPYDDLTIVVCKALAEE